MESEIKEISDGIEKVIQALEQAAENDLKSDQSLKSNHEKKLKKEF